MKICGKCKKEKEDGQNCYSMVSVPSGPDKDGVIQTITKPMFSTWICSDCLEEAEKGTVQGFSISGKVRRKDIVKKIIVVGLGALGSHFIQIARNLKVQFVGIDFDRVEQKNLASQFHTRMGLNKNKAQALQQTMKGLYGLQMQAIPHKLTADNVAQLLGDADVVVDCLDNGASRRVIQAFVREKGIECLHGALAADGQFGSVLWDEQFKVDDEYVEGQPTCDGGEFLPFILDVASAMVRCLQDYLENGKKSGFQMLPYNKILL